MKKSLLAIFVTALIILEAIRFYYHLVRQSMAAARS
jgi:hypothetical protein